MTNADDDLKETLFQLARLSLAGRPQDIQSFIRRVARQYLEEDATFAERLTALLRKLPTRSSPLRKQTDVAVPVDADTRFQLLRIEEKPALDREPVYTENVKQNLDNLIAERQHQDRLSLAGLDPTRTAIFTGPSGVGKTMAARWIAKKLNRPLLILDLAAVMSSFLGRTGTNLKNVLDYAKSFDCVLLLDELDALAKRRDDRSEIGELKRLVTVLIQQLDDWPPTGLLIAASNHADLLDPAIWRRFETSVEFPLPNEEARKLFLGKLLRLKNGKKTDWTNLLTLTFKGLSFHDIEREIVSAKRSAALSGVNLEKYLPALVRTDQLDRTERVLVATKLVDRKLVTQRRAQELTGVSRDTIRAHAKKMRKSAKESGGRR